MNKKNLAKQYLMDNVVIDLDYIDEIKSQPREQIIYMGGVKHWYVKTKTNHEILQNAINYANYKNKISDRNWQTVIALWQEVVYEKLDMLV